MANINGPFPEFHPELRITETFSGIQVLEQVFTKDQIEVVGDLLTEVSSQGVIKAGGRRIRELLGCSTIDLSGKVANDAQEGLNSIERAWLKPIISQLEVYPDLQKSKPDADFFTTGIDLRQVEQLAKARGLKTNIITGTGNINVIEILGENGSATFVDANSSWQTQEWWPKYAVKAPLGFENGQAVFKVDCAWDSMYTYPLEIPGIASFSDFDPRKVVVVGRSLLWQELSTDPQGHRLKEPSLNTQREVVKTVEILGNLLEKITQEPSLLKNYASGIRDISLALRMIVPNEPRTEYQQNLAGTFLESIRK